MKILKKIDNLNKLKNLDISEKLIYNFLTDKEEDIPIEESQIDYDALINLDKKDFSLELKQDFTKKENDENIIFYCKSCKKITDILDVNDSNNENIEKKINVDIKFRRKKKQKNKKKIHLICELCNKEDIIIGTKRGISEHFHLNN